MNKIECINLSKSFFLNSEELNVLNEINLSIEESNLIAITGKSGAGKSTLTMALTRIVEIEGGIGRIQHKS